MQQGIHPDYMETEITCGCGSSFTTRSTVEKLTVDICSACHPFYTGQMKFVDSAGRVEKFQKKYNWDERRKAQAEAEEKAKADSQAKAEKAKADSEAEADDEAKAEKAKGKGKGKKDKADTEAKAEG